MTNLENIKATFEQIGVDVRAIKTNVGVLENLPSEAKDSLVNALIELWERVNNLDSDTIIDDSLEESTSKTYSIDKIKNIIDAAINNLVDNAPEAMNTLAELANYIEVHGDIMEALQEAVTDRVAYTPQENSEERKQVARENIDAPKTSKVVGVGLNSFEQDDVFTGNINTLPNGNYVTALKDVTGLPTEVLEVIGEPVTAFVVGGNIFFTRLIVGDRSIAFWNSLSNTWGIIGGGTVVQDTHISDVILVDYSMISGQFVKFESSSPISTSKRFDVFCNGVLISPEAVEVIDDVFITIDTELAGYRIEEGFNIVLKYVLK